MIIPPLQPDTAPEQANSPSPPPKGPACMNCGATLRAKFCHVCGQRKQRRVVSLFLLAGEYVQELFDIESRLWRTLWPLFARPGKLTKSFIAGQREHYVPPVRLYLISSIIFFLLVSLSPRSILSEATEFINSMKGVENSEFSQGKDSPVTGLSIVELSKKFRSDEPENTADLAPEDSSEDESTDGDVSTVTLDSQDVAGVDDEPEQNETETVPTTQPVVTDGDSNEASGEGTDKSDVVFKTAITDDDQGDITEEDLQGFYVSNVCESILNDEDTISIEALRLPFYRGCVSMSTWGGFLDFLSDFIDDLPKTLLILLPLMALVNKLLYLFARRYYVEHLLYYVHNFSFLFLFCVLLTGIVKLSAFAGVDAAVSNLLIPFGVLYTIYYFFKSMRVVYGQGFFFTLSKWIALNITFMILVMFVIVFFTLATATVHGI